MLSLHSAKLRILRILLNIYMLCFMSKKVTDLLMVS
nr:MAG TPA: hypothetical protein [Caudoviricetes sp.]